MSDLITVEAMPLAGIASPDKGPPPQLQWVPISDLRVDPSYQRQITLQGRKNILKIAQSFRWSRFAPVIVSPIEGGAFAIIDGQHRTTAAASIGIKQVPCQVILADRAEQAAAFSAINGNVTRINSLALHRAAVAAGDPDAVRLDALARECGVTILGYPKSEATQGPGETMALETLRRSVGRHGAGNVMFVLKAIMGGKHAVVGCLGSTIIEAVIEFVADEAQRFDEMDRNKLAAFIGGRSLVRDLDHVRGLGAVKGVSRAQQLRAYLAREFDGSGKKPVPKTSTPAASLPRSPYIAPASKPQSSPVAFRPAVSPALPRAVSTTPVAKGFIPMPSVLRGIGFTPRECVVLDMLRINAQASRTDLFALLADKGMALKSLDDVATVVIAPLMGRLAKIGARITAVPGGYRLGLDGKTLIDKMLREPVR